MKGNKCWFLCLMLFASILLAFCSSARAADSFFDFPWFSVPALPTLSVTMDGDRVTLTWDTVARAKGYRVYADQAQGKDFDGSFDLSWDLGTKTSITITLWPGADVYFSVTAYNGRGESGYSNIVQVGLPPTIPTLTLTTGESQATLSWNGVPGAQGYRIYADHANHAPFDGTFDLNWDFHTTSATVKLWPGADVYYAVTAYNAAGESGFSNIVRLFPSPADHDWVSIAAGDDHSVALKADGSLWAWGRNQYGQLGDGTNMDRVTPTRIGEETDWAAVFAGGSQTVLVDSGQSFAIKADGTLWGWGNNSHGQLGDGTKENRWVPIQIGTDHDWTTLSTRLHNSVAVKKDGTLWAWGNISWSPGSFFGDPVHLDEDTLFPTRVGQDADWVGVTASEFFAVALKSDHTIWEWGGEYYQFSSIQREPFQIGNDADWQSISAGEKHVVALKVDGTLWTWGWAFYGALGNGEDGVDTYVPDPVKITSESDWAFVHAGAQQTYAIKSDGTLWAWGENSQGQLGEDTAITRSFPTRIGFDHRWRAVAAGNNHVIGLQSDGTLWAWGRGEYGERGDGIESTDTDVPVQIEPTIQWRNTGAGFGFSLAIDRDGSLWTWGQPLIPDMVNSGRSIGLLIQVGSDLDWSMASGGNRHAAGIKTDGTLWTWGLNVEGQLGDGTRESRYQPVRIGLDSDWRSVDAGGIYTVAIKTDGTLWAWGRNDNGQLGDGTHEARDTPIQIGADNDWVAASASIQNVTAHTVAVKTDGTLWTWGANFVGQLGDGTAEDKNYPVRVGSDRDWKMVAAGDYHTAAIKEDHSLWTWGLNGLGQLGVGSRENKLTPVQVGDSKAWKTVACGYSHTVAIKLDGTLWIWGLFSLGQLGKNQSFVELRPIQIGSDTDWESISAGTYHMLALKRDGALWALGLHGYAKIQPVNVVLGSDPQ